MQVSSPLFSSQKSGQKGPAGKTGLKTLAARSS